MADAALAKKNALTADKTAAAAAAAGPNRKPESSVLTLLPPMVAGTAAPGITPAARLALPLQAGTVVPDWQPILTTSTRPVLRFIAAGVPLNDAITSPANGLLLLGGGILSILGARGHLLNGHVGSTEQRTSPPRPSETSTQVPSPPSKRSEDEAGRLPSLLAFGKDGFACKGGTLAKRAHYCGKATRGEGNKMGGGSGTFEVS